MYCTFCGTGLPSSALFCSKCGLKLVSQEENEKITSIENKIKSDSSIPEKEKNPLLSKDFLKSKNLGKKMCLGCGLVLGVFSQECLTCKGTLFRWPDPDPILGESTRTNIQDKNSQTTNRNWLLLNKDSKLLISGISALVISLLLIFSLYQSRINPNGETPSSVTTNSETIIPGITECDNPGDISSDGQYMCAGHGAFYWLPIEDLATFSNEDSSNESSNDSNNGYWTTNCVNVEVPNPNYNASKGFSAFVNEPTIRTRQCSQVWVEK